MFADRNERARPFFNQIIRVGGNKNEVCFIANLPVRKLKGVDSQGMILSTINADGKLCIVQPQKPTKPGCTVE